MIVIAFLLAISPKFQEWVPDRGQETALQERFEGVGARPVVKTK